MQSFWNLKNFPIPIPSLTLSSPALFLYMFWALKHCWINNLKTRLPAHIFSSHGCKSLEKNLIQICFPPALHFSIIQKLKITNDIKKIRKGNVPYRSIKQRFHANFIIMMKKNNQKKGEPPNKTDGNHAKRWWLLKIQSTIVF